MVQNDRATKMAKVKKLEDEFKKRQARIEALVKKQQEITLEIVGLGNEQAKSGMEISKLKVELERLP